MSKSNRILKSISWLVREIRFLISLIFLFIYSVWKRKLSGIGILSDLTHVLACFDLVEIASYIILAMETFRIFIRLKFKILILSSVKIN